MEKKMRTQKETVIRAGIALLISFFLTGIWFLIVYQKIPFIYDINDDVAMRNVAAGVITGTPDAHLLHIKYVLGLFISGLYRLLPGLDWYGIVLTGILLFAAALILYRGLSAEQGIGWKTAYVVLFLLLLTCLGLLHVTAFQWTTVAGIAGASGIYLFYTAGEREDLVLYLEEGLAVLMILISLLIRDDVFLMMLPIAALCFWWKYRWLKRERDGTWKFRLRHFGVPAGLLAGTILILGVEAFAYRSPEWKTFRDYNTDREAIMDYYGLPDYEEAPEIYDALGMTPEEAENLQRYSLYLAEDLYSDKMAKLAEYSRERYLQQNPLKVRIRSAMSQIWEHLRKDTYHHTNVLSLGMMVLTFMYCMLRNRRQMGLVCSVLVVWGAYWFYLGFRNRILERVGFVLYLLVFLVMLAIWYRTSCLSGENGRTGRIWTALAGLACLVLMPMTGKVWTEVRENNSWRSDYNQRFLDVNDYMAEHSDNVYFMTTFSIETYTDNFTIQRDFAFSNLLSVGGWHTFSPLENEKDALLGISDAKRDIVEKENVYVISLENINLRYMDRYYTSLYGDGYLGRELVDTLDFGEQIFEVYDFTAEEEAG